jgi:hypothetical protein
MTSAETQEEALRDLLEAVGVRGPDPESAVKDGLDEAEAWNRNQQGQRSPSKDFDAAEDRRRRVARHEASHCTIALGEGPASGRRLDRDAPPQRPQIADRRLRSF